jgi:hypothetical protein
MIKIYDAGCRVQGAGCRVQVAGCSRQLAVGREPGTGSRAWCKMIKIDRYLIIRIQII